jgi:two-component system, OmpR family, alkaline phosphatase synthesis response regulator PhoP
MTTILKTKVESYSGLALRSEPVKLVNQNARNEQMKKILVIEDDKAIQSVVLKLLTAEGFEAIGSDSGTTGVELAQQLLPDLIICDVMMPKLDGFAVLTTLRQQSATATIPFIFLTAKTDRTDFRQGMELGADDYVTKPFTRGELVGAITARLNKQAVVLEQLNVERQEKAVLEQKMQSLQVFTEAKDSLLNNLSEELRNPLSNIRMALQMLKTAQTSVQRDRYLQILQAEFAREISLLNQVSELQRLLTPDNVTLLRQFNLLKSNSDAKDSGY